MSSRERVIRTLRHEAVDRAPRDLWALPGVGLDRPTELRRMRERFPSDFAAPRVTFGRSQRATGNPHLVGEYTDDWGAVWRVAERGVIGEVVAPPLADWAALAHYRPPFELLTRADFSQVEQGYAATDCFVRAGLGAGPFERLQFLRGSQQLFIDLAYGSGELYQALTMVHDYNCRQLELWAATPVDGVSINDDWGAQHSLLIAPDLWRTIFKPLYRDYCDILSAAGKYIFFHSDGHIEAIYPDLIELGVQALNSQLFCMDLEGLAARHRGQVTFWGEIDRQRVLPFGSPDDARAAVRRVRLALDRGQGGVIAQCEWGVKDPAANIAAVFEEWERPLDEILAAD